MEPKAIAKETLNLSKITFDNAFRAMELLQEQVQRMTDIYLHQILAFPEEGKNVADTWTEACRANRDEFKKVVESNYEMLASFFKDEEQNSAN